MTPQVCTEIKYLAQDEVTSRPALRLSHEGKRIAYVVQVSNLHSDQYDDALYVVRLGNGVSSKPRLLITNRIIGGINWFPDDRHLAVLMLLHGKIVLSAVDSETGTYEVIKEAHGDVTDFSMDSSGTAIAIGVKVPNHYAAVNRSIAENRNGYRVSLDSLAQPDRPRRLIYVLHRVRSHLWTMDPPLSFISPLSGLRLTSVVDNHALHIDLSPNGRYLIIDNLDSLSVNANSHIWTQSRTVDYLTEQNTVMLVSYLYDVQTQKVSMLLDSPAVRDGMWSPDSNTYVKVAVAPVGSKWEQKDLSAHAPSEHYTHLFSIDIHTGDILEVLERAESVPLAWTRDGDLVLQDSAGTIRTLIRKSGVWKEKGSFQISLPDRSPYAPMVSDGQHFVMEYEDASTAPEILQFEPESRKIQALVKLNPQADRLILPRIEHFDWTTSTGYQAKGILLLPPDYDSRLRYPLVIENGSLLYNGEFVCDSGEEHVSSFARGILADSGIVYLMRSWSGNVDWKNNYYPKGYPGGLSEAAFQLDLVESAVRALGSRQLIDPDKIGLIGFSRGGWYTEYALTQSRQRFAAATASDNALYSMGEYWSLYDNVTIRAEEGMYGGPPYGTGLTNWLKYSISFNLDKFHTPLLIEVMGDGVENDNPARPPSNLLKHYEEFVGLSRLDKPVELYYYPLEQHQIDHPLARIAALQRNVDWYRFWLQGHERPNPEDSAQYRRWERLRDLQHLDSKLLESSPTR